MMYFKFVVSAFTLSIALFSANCLADQTAPLSPKLIEQWISSQQAFEAWGKIHEDALSNYDSSVEDVQNPMSMSVDSMIKPLKAVGLYDSANELAKKNGFYGMEHWAETTLRITKAAAALELEAHPAMLDISKLKALANSPNIDPKQKKMLLKAIENNKSITEQLTSGSSSADKQAIAPYLKRINKLMEQNL